MSMEFNRRIMLAATAASMLPLSFSEAADQQQSVGPMIGHVSETTAKLWYRPQLPGRYLLHVSAEGGERYEKTFAADAKSENDLCITWQVNQLSPGTKYDYYVIGKGGKVATGSEFHFQTAPDQDAKSKISLAFGSCASMEPTPLWTQIQEHAVEGLVLLGDTPYIDSTNLEVARDKHRQFLSIPPLSNLVQNTPTWGTWDDHDFGRNDSDGRLKGKENTRQAFVEYRANAQFGEKNQGIFCKFRYGPVEVFLLDTRWFSRTEASSVSPDQPTLLGKAQWNWLRQSLKESTAPFKLITCGMIWDDKENSESDDWGTYSYERDALFQFLGEENINGVLLIGGDIHCSRLLKYKTKATVGYPIYQMIVSPLHDRTIPALNVAHPDLIHGAAIPHVWLKLSVDSTVENHRLRAQWIQLQGRPMWELSLNETELQKG